MIFSFSKRSKWSGCFVLSSLTPPWRVATLLLSSDWSKSKMSEPITIIGANTVVNGNLECDEDLTIAGRVEGTVKLSTTLTVDITGVVHANVNVRKAVISGVIVGNIEAQDSVHITEQGRVMGDIVAPRVVLAEGASFLGNIDMGELNVDRLEAAVSPPKNAPHPNPPPAKSKSTASEKKEAPNPKVRSVGKAKATRKRRA
jgi:cytoskeletal protein CcmA (bactofilin family)